MPCLKAPSVSVPDIFPLSFSPPSIPLPPFNADLCCKIVAFAIPPIPLPLPPKTVNPAFMKGLRAFGKTVLAALDKLQVKCPKESPSSALVGS